jgi:eukaryotic-like serine/threonine-protein kinase
MGTSTACSALPMQERAQPSDALDGRSDASATDTQSREEMRAFLQKRVAAFGLLLTVTWGLLLTWRVVNTLSEDDSPSKAYLPGQALSVATFAATWLLCRAGRRSLTFVRSIETICLLIAAAGVVAMCFRVSYAARPDTILFFCLSYTLIARSILVPSEARRTFLLCLFFGVVHVVSVYFIHRLHHDPTIYTAASDPRLRLDAATIARRWTVIAAMWWTVALTIATATSKVIYGLRREVRDARRLGQYTLLEKLGEGGMGAVYSVRHAMLRRPTAIKLLPPDKFGARSVARFEREVQLTARLTHPNTIRIFDYGRTPDGIFYYAMEYLEGASLADVIEESGPMPPARVIHVLDQVAGALAEAHGIGLIHRDIKPANVFLTEQGGVPDVAKVLDFGLVKQLGETSGDPLTRTDTLTGTPLYMAPEAITSPDQIDARTDLYAVGAVGYFLLTGHDVFTGRTVVEVCSHHLHSTPIPPTQRLGRPIDADLEGVILRCLEKDPAARPSDARSLQRELRACRAARSWSEEDARHWFEMHAESLHARQSRNIARGSPATIDIDLARRLAEPLDQREAG